MKEKLFYLFTLIAITLTITACHIDFTKEEERPSSTPVNPQPVEEDNSDDTDQTGNTGSSEIIPVIKKIPQYFWGIWQRMDNGQYYTINEDSIVFKNHIYSLKAVNNESIIVDNLGTLKKQSDSVMVNGAIPYFRNGGTNLSYTMKLVGFTDSSTRSADNTSFADYTITGKSSSYASFISTAKANAEGTVTLSAPVSGDRQTIFVTSGDSTIAVVPGVMVETNGSNMGTIPISQTGEYSLKVTGTIPEDEKDNGYLYGNNYKSYPMTLTITNISDVTSAPSICTIEAADPRISVSAANGEDIEGGVFISTMKTKISKKISLQVSCGTLTGGYIDSGLIVTVENAATGKTWQDYVPLRFFAGLVPITVAAESIENNYASSLNGFVIYPDGNSQFFTIPHTGDKTVYIPSFNTEEKIILSFCGATVEGSLSASTEMLYTVAPGTSEKKQIEKDANSFRQSVRLGEEDSKNETEDTAYSVTQSFQAYLADSDIDYFSLVLTEPELARPDMSRICTIKYVSEHGTAPSEKNIDEGTYITQEYLPALQMPHYTFNGWYLGTLQISEYFYQVNCNITLTAKWTPVEYSINYILDGDVINDGNPAKYTVDNEDIVLKAPERKGYIFNGWEERNENETKIIETIPSGSFGNKYLYATWEIETYSIEYNSNGGNIAGIPRQSFTIESETFSLPPATKTGYTFGGWHEKVNFSDSPLSKINKGSYGDKTLYANWILNTYTVTFETNGGNSISPKSYSIESSTFTLPTPTRNGYTFAGWYDNNDFLGSSISFIEKGSIGNKVFYAKWDVIEHTITYILDGGTNDTANISHFNIESPLFMLQAPTKEDAAFLGWFDDESFSGDKITKIDPAINKDVILYAKYLLFENNYIINNLSDLTRLDPQAFTQPITLTVMCPIYADNEISFIQNYIRNLNVFCRLNLSNVQSLCLSRMVSSDVYEGTFENLEKLFSVILPESTSYIGKHTFTGCRNLQEIYCTSSKNIEVDKCAFLGCSNLIKVDSWLKISYIGERAFAGCSALESITLSQVWTLYKDAFQGCSNLKSIFFPDSSSLSTDNIVITNPIDLTNPYYNPNYFDGSYTYRSDEWAQNDTRKYWSLYNSRVIKS